MAKQKKYVVLIRVDTPYYEECIVNAPSKKEAIAAVKDNVSWRVENNFAQSSGMIHSDGRNGTHIDQDNRGGFDDPRQAIKKRIVSGPKILQIDQLNKS
tara:strand:- start:11 stop:307 length:297 start_codon:yes stop_codon:yes gene_type:complete